MSTIPVNPNDSIKAELNRMKLVASARKTQKVFLHYIMVMHFNSSKTNYPSTRSKDFQG